MRWLFLAILLLSIPVLVSYAGRGERQRNHLILALGPLFFATGAISLDAALITWPLWPGTARGMMLSFVDTIAIALLLTRRGRIRIPPFLGLCALFLIPMVAASFVASVKLASVFAIFQFAQIVFLYFVLSQELSRAGAIRALLKGIAIGLIVQAGFVAYQKFTGVVQAPGTFTHQNVLGLMAQLAAAPLLAAILEGERSKLAYAGVIAAAICVAGGGSRASLVFFALVLVLTVLISLMRRSSPRKWKIVGMGVVLSALMIPLALGTLKDRFGTLQISTEDQSRVAFERAASAMAADHPFGVGPNNFVTVNNMQGYGQRAGIEWGGGLLDKPVHNAYLLARAETGWFGQITLVLLIAWVALTAYRMAFSARRVPAVGIAAGSAAGITTIALHSNYEFAWYVLELQRLFFVNAALVAGCIAMAAEAKLQNRNARRLRPAAHDPQAGATAGAGKGQGVIYGN